MFKFIFFILLVFSSNCFSQEQNSKSLLIFSISNLNWKKFKLSYEKKFNQEIGPHFSYEYSYSPDNWSLIADFFAPIDRFSASFYSTGLPRKDSATFQELKGLNYFYSTRILDDALKKQLLKDIKGPKNFVGYYQLNTLFLPYYDSQIQFDLSVKERELIEKKRKDFNQGRHDYLTGLLFSAGLGKEGAGLTVENKEKFYRSNEFKLYKNLLLKLYNQKLDFFMNNFFNFYSEVKAKIGKESVIVFVGNHGEPLFENGNIHWSNDLNDEDHRVMMKVVTPAVSNYLQENTPVKTFVVEQVMTSFMSGKKIDAETLRSFAQKRNLYFRSCTKEKVSLINSDREKIVLNLRSNDFKIFNLDSLGEIEVKLSKFKNTAKLFNEIQHNQYQARKKNVNRMGCDNED